MPRTLYTSGLRQVDWASDVIRIALLRDTSTYTPDPDHDFVDDVIGGGPGGVEITVASYARQTLANAAVADDDAKDQSEYDADDVAFGNLENGQTVKAFLIYKQVGGDDASPSDDPVIVYEDGKIDVVLAADAAQSATTIWVQPLEGDIPDGAALDFGGGKTATVNGVHSRGDRSIDLTGGALAAAATAGDTSECNTTMIKGANLLGALQDGPFNVNFNADGVIVQTQRGKFAT